MPSQPPYPFRQALPWTAFVALLFWLSYSARGTLSPLLVSVEADLRIGHASSTSLLLMQSLGFSVSLLLCGFMLSRVRPAHMAAFSIITSGLILLMMPLVQTLAQARIVFFVFGFTSGFYFPSGMATLSSLVHPQDWGKAVAVHELAPNVAFIFIPLIVQAALLFTVWQGVFATLGATMVGVGLSFLRFGRGGSSYSAPPSFNGIHAMLRDPAVWAIMALLAIVTIGEFSIFSILQIFLVNSLTLAPDTANIAIAATRLGTPIAVIIGGLLADKHNVYRVLYAGLLVHALALGLMCLPFVPVVLLACGLQAMSIAALFPSIFKAMAHAFSADRQPVLMSLSMPLAGIISAGLVPLFLGWCGQYLSFSVGLACVAVASLLSLASVLLLEKRQR